MAFFRAQEPVILKEGSDAKEQLATLESLRETVPRSQRRRLDSDIRALKAGIVGEDRILFELRNSHASASDSRRFEGGSGSARAGLVRARRSPGCRK